MRYFELRVGGLGPFTLGLLAWLRCWYTCFQRPTTCGTSAETDLFRWCCLCNFTCQTDLFQLDNSTGISVWILVMLILWLVGFLGLVRFTFGRFGLSIQFRCFTERCLSGATISWDLLGIYHFTYVAAMAGNSLSYPPSPP